MSLVGKTPKRMRLIRNYKTELQAFLQTDRSITFPHHAAPTVSVIIPVFNSAFHTYRCLESLAKDTKTKLEVIVFNNASSDETAELLQRCKNIVVVNSAKNLGFVGANGGGQVIF